MLKTIGKVLDKTIRVTAGLLAGSVLGVGVLGLPGAIIGGLGLGIFALFFAEHRPDEVEKWRGISDKAKELYPSSTAYKRIFKDGN